MTLYCFLREKSRKETKPSRSLLRAERVIDEVLGIHHYLMGFVGTVKSSQDFGHCLSDSSFCLGREVNSLILCIIHLTIHHCDIRCTELLFAVVLFSFSQICVLLAYCKGPR